MLRAQHRGARRHRAHRDATTEEIVDGDGARRARWRSPTAASSTPTWSSSRPASGRATSWRAPADLAVGERGGIVDRRRAAAPPTPTSTPSASARCYERPHLRPGRARLPDGARRRRRRSPAASERFTGADMSTKLKLLGVDVASFGDAFAAHARRARHQLRRPAAPASTRSWSSRADGKRLLGGVLVGDAADYGAAAAARAERRSPLPPHAGDADPAAARGRQAGRRSASTRCPTPRTICSCNNVSKGAICAAIARAELHRRRRGQGVHARPAPAAASACRWSTELLKAELKRAGVAVNNHLCEHFPHSPPGAVPPRPRPQASRRFDDAARRATARGRGCEICKPAVASILASAWNEHVLDAEAPAAAGHQRPLPRQHPARRHLLGRPARPRRRDHARPADRASAQVAEEVRPLHEDHRRPAHRPVRRARRAAARDLGASWSPPASSPATPTARRCAR